MSGKLATAARRVAPLDWTMLALALLSVVALGFESWGDLAESTRGQLRTLDTALCAVFAAEFLWRWRADGWRRGYLGRNWYEIVGMIPVAHPALRGFRLLRVVRIVVMLSRLGMAADRSFGDEFTYRLVARFKNAIADSISDAVTVAVLKEVGAVLGQGTYTANISRALEENQRELRGMILEKLRNDPQTGRLRRLPFYDDIVESVIDAGLRVFEEVLKDPRTDELVADVLRENLIQIEAAVRARQSRSARLQSEVPRNSV